MTCLMSNMKRPSYPAHDAPYEGSGAMGGSLFIPNDHVSYVQFDRVPKSSGRWTAETANEVPAPLL